MLIVAGYIDVAPEGRAEFLAARMTTIAATREEPGCLEYTFAADATDPGRVRVFERWETADDLETHLARLSTRPQSTVEVIGRELLRYEISDIGPLRP